MARAEIVVDHLVPRAQRLVCRVLVVRFRFGAPVLALVLAQAPVRVLAPAEVLVPVHNLAQLLACDPVQVLDLVPVLLQQG